MLTMRSALERAQHLYGENRAIADTERSFTWAEHMDRVMRLTAVLQSKGVGKGDRFGIVCRNTWRHCELIHAGYWNGSIPVPVNFRLAPPEIRNILDDAAVNALFLEDVFLAYLETPEFAPWRDSAVVIPGEGTATMLETSDALIGVAAPSEGNDSGEEEDAILLYTGGTTGQSKGVRLSHRNIFSNGMQCSVPMKAAADDIYLHAAPMFHSADLLGTAYTLVGGAHAYLPAFTPDNLMRTIQDTGATAMMMAPTMIILTLQSPDIAKYDLSSFRRVLYGSAPMAVEWIRRLM
ncbi:MAG: AMP-binding protein, partial [Rickettsiales bacterium]